MGGELETGQLRLNSAREAVGFASRYGPETGGLDVRFWQIGSTDFPTPSRNWIFSSALGIRSPQSC